MRLDGLRRSTNVEHRGGGGGGLLVGGGGIGALLIAGLVYLLGGDPSVVLQGQPQAGRARARPTRAPRKLSSSSR